MVQTATISPVVSRILEGYGVKYREILPPQKGYRNRSYPVILENGTILNLILYKRETGILQRVVHANKVSNFLYSKDFPTRQTESTKLAILKSERDPVVAVLYNYLPGQTIPWEAYTKDHLKLIGKTMGDMHSVLFDLHVKSLPKVTDEYQAIIKRTQLYFKNANVQDALKIKLGLQVNLSNLDLFLLVLQSCGRLLGQHPLHMDFVRSNILFENDVASEDLKYSVSGILDFEKTACGHPVFDIARTLSFLLVDCKFKSESKVRKYFLYSGYQKRGATSYKSITIKNNNSKINVLESLLDMFLFYDFYKFLKHNPYEYLAKNEHFTRTKDLLLERGVVSLATP